MFVLVWKCLYFKNEEFWLDLRLSKLSKFPVEKLEKTTTNCYIGAIGCLLINAIIVYY